MSFADLIARARRNVEEGLVPSCQLALAREGELIAFETLGAASNDDHYTIWSVTKGIVASAIWRLVGEGKLRYEDRIADHIPGFEAKGKGAVTLDHVMLHTAGIPRAPMRPEEGAVREGRRARFESWRLDCEPGSATAYHTTSAHWVLADLIETASGEDFRTFVTSLTGIALGSADPLDVQIVGDASAMGTVQRADGDVLELPEIESDLILRYNEPAVRAAGVPAAGAVATAVRAAGVPAAGAVATAAEVALFFQELMHNREGRWEPAVLEDATHNVRNTLPDPYTRVPANRTRGLVVAGDDGMESLRGFGPGVSPQAFASPGLGGQIAWADPESGLSFVYLTNGIDADLVRAFRRSISLSKLAAEVS